MSKLEQSATMPSPTTEPLLFVGIDPGSSGGIAVISAATKVVDIGSFTTWNEYDIWQFVQELAKKGKVALAVIEKNTGYVGGPGNTGSSMFTFGTSYGLLLMALVAAKIRFERITPRVWQKGSGITPKSKKESKQDFKRRLKTKAQDLFPSEKVTLATADALLIAEYARLRYYQVYLQPV